MGQTLNMLLGQASLPTFTVIDSSGNPVPSGSYSVSAVFADPTIASFGGIPGELHALKLGSTTVTWTIAGVASAGYTGSVTIGPDAIDVNPKTVQSATVAYGTPA